MTRSVLAAGLAVIIFGGAVGVVAAGLPTKHVPEGRAIVDGVDDGIPLPEPELPNAPNSELPSGKGWAGQEVPAGAVFVPAPELPTAGKVEAQVLRTFLAEQRAALDPRWATARTQQTDAILGAITFRRGLPPTEATAILAGAGVQPAYFEWQSADGPDHGGSAWQFLDSVLAEHPKIAITFVTTMAPPKALSDLARNADVWLVDIGAAGDEPPTPGVVYGMPRNYFDLAEELGVLDE